MCAFFFRKGDKASMEVEEVEEVSGKQVCADSPFPFRVKQTFDGYILEKKQ